MWRTALAASFLSFRSNRVRAPRPAEEWAKFCGEAKADPAAAEGGRKIVALRRRRAKAA